MNIEEHQCKRRCLDLQQIEIARLNNKITQLESEKANLEHSLSEPAILLTCKQVKEIYDFGAPDGTADQEETEMVIKWFNEGYSGAGYYCYYADYPEEGAIALFENEGME